MLDARTALLVAVAVLGSASAASAQATLAGSVLNDPGERPIANAEIVIRDVNKTSRSDNAGNFKITGIAAGDHSVMVRMAGYEPWIGSLTFVDGQTIEADFMMKPVVTKLDTVEIKAPETRYALELRDFEERRRTGVGYFLTSDVFARNEGRRLSNILLGSVPAIRAVGKTDQVVIHASHGNGKSGFCPVQVVLNDLFVFRGAPGEEPFDVNSINAADVIGVEYYTVSTTPLRYQGTGAPTVHGNPQGPACGTLIIWTK